MKVEERRRVLGTLLDGIKSGTTAICDGIMKSPNSDFTCPDLLAQEQRVFFRETPLLMGLSTILPKPNTYWADSATGVPILMIRDSEGTFRAFGNTCRHRGAQVVPDGRGEGERFPCPFHAWTYNTKGELIAVNRERNFGSVCKAEHSLVELPSAEKYGTLWVQPSLGGPIDVDECLGGLQDDMKHWKLEKHLYGETQNLDAAINWKLAIDTFGENYHFDVLHRDSLAQSLKGNLQTHDVYGLNYRMLFATQSFEAITNVIPNKDDWPFRHIVLSVYFIYPNTIFLVDPYFVDVLRIFPLDNLPGQSRTVHNCYVRDETFPYFQENEESYKERFDGFNAIIEREDYPTAATSQRGAESGLVEHILFGKNEPALHHYHNAHRKGLGRPLLEVEEVA